MSWKVKRDADRGVEMDVEKDMQHYEMERDMGCKLGARWRCELEGGMEWKWNDEWDVVCLRNDTWAGFFMG